MIHTGDGLEMGLTGVNPLLRHCDYIASINHGDTRTMNATALGYTRAIMASDMLTDLTLWIKPDTDLDERFPAICDLTGEKLYINGWACNIEEGH